MQQMANIATSVLVHTVSVNTTFYWNKQHIVFAEPVHLMYSLS